MRSAKVTANAFSAGFHRTAHRAWPVPLGSRPRVTRYSVLRAACSVGKCPRTVIARRYLACRDSIALVDRYESPWRPVCCFAGPAVVSALRCDRPEQGFFWETVWAGRCYSMG
jgi:hypothetical protein